MKNQLDELKSKWRQYADLDTAFRILLWDQATYMPLGGGKVRARQLATLAKLSHEHLVDPSIGKLLDELEIYADDLDKDSDDARLIKVARREYERAIKIPAEFLSVLEQHAASTYQIWTQAREENSYELVEPKLHKTLELSREYAEFLQPYEHIADPLIDEYEPELTAATVRSIFDALRPKLVDLLQQIEQHQAFDQSVIHQEFSSSAQLDFTRELIAKLGYDMEHGRQDVSPHPFTTLGSSSDVRITTWVDEHDITKSLYASIHEAGHAMYEQGIPPEFDATPLAHGASISVHESQSRLWENLIGRSRAFCSWLFPLLKESFPQQFKDAKLDDFYKAINTVRNSLIRTGADEVTYNLHVMIRFELELQMLEGQLDVADLPKAWNNSYEENLGVRPEDYKDGVLQDTHWYRWTIGGAFQGYTLGNILSAQFYDSAVRSDPEIEQGIERGDFEPLRDWLSANIYRHGRKFTATEMAEMASGTKLDINPYVSYLRSKYGELYGL